MISLIIAITSAVTLGWKIYSDVKKEKKTSAKFDIIVKNLPGAVDEFAEMEREWKAWRKKNNK